MDSQVCLQVQVEKHVKVEVLRDMIQKYSKVFKSMPKYENV